MLLTSPVELTKNSNNTISSPGSRSAVGTVPDFNMGGVTPLSGANVTGPAPHILGWGCKPKLHANRNATSTGDPSFAPGVKRHLRMHSVALSSMPYPAGFTTSTSRTLPSDLTTSERVTSPCARTFLAKSGISQVVLNITEGGETPFPT